MTNVEKAIANLQSPFCNIDYINVFECISFYPKLIRLRIISGFTASEIAVSFEIIPF